ncbi:MAG: hypothetical protein ACRDMA_16185 [Solirubrobacterales bacterium]
MLLRRLLLLKLRRDLRALNGGDHRALLSGPGGEQLYRNRTALLIRTRWGRIVEHEDFYEDTQRIQTFEARLRELGVEPAS